MDNTHTLSRRIVAALVERGIEVPLNWLAVEVVRGKDGINRHGKTVCGSVPDLAQPENLHLLLEVADGLGGRPCGLWWERESSQWASIAYIKSCHTKPQLAHTRSLAILAAVCAALGIDTTQEDE